MIYDRTSNTDTASRFLKKQYARALSLPAELALR